MKPVFVVFITYKRLDCLKRTVSSLLPSLPPGSKVIVYDNYSNETETEDYLRSIAKDNVHVVLGNQNVGWAQAVNEVLDLHDEWKEFEYVLESNNDVLYNANWYREAKEAMLMHPKIGILGLWKHPHHGVRSYENNFIVKDNMPAVAWLFRSKDLETFLPFPERGATKTRGGNGEDTDMVTKVQAMDRWVGGMPEDLAVHMDGVDPKAGQDNENY